MLERNFLLKIMVLEEQVSMLIIIEMVQFDITYNSNYNVLCSLKNEHNVKSIT